MRRIGLLLLISILLVACSETSDTKGNNDSNEITAWAWDPKFNIAALELAEKSYDGEEEVELKIIENAQDDIISKLNTGLGSGTMKGMPNIVLIEDYRAQSFLQSYPDVFYDLSDYLNAEDFADYKIEPTSLDGKMYGLPFDTGVTGLFIRTDILEEAGYTVEDFKDITWDEYIEMGKDIREKTGKHMLTLDFNDLGIIRVMAQSAGKWYLEEDGVTPDLANNEALKESFRIFKTLIDEDVAGIHTDWSQLLAGFNSGDVVSAVQGSWIIPSIKAEESQSGKWEVVPIPRLNLKESVSASNLGGSSFYVLNIDGKEKAAEFLKNTFGSNVEFYQDLMREVGAVGTFLPAAEGEAYQTEDAFFSGQKIYADLASWMEQVPPINYGIHTYSIEDILIVEMQNYFNGQDVDKVLESAQKQVESR
ncbi:ABC transporter substrate-binding protein [Sporosarcina pasteurii]|uniref:Lactose-binding protein n=1 Tax=Sporosarcina pasteurii TaxID=1474 RepID=A0A380BDA8_SPOPA|nr:extracellular solute-binding protein [Sporosarcina pasteurii]MDS9472509.1 extracellular solute-binding protein [Sporosarcina pasteurii]QBQ06062.1 extracellular solute-binding protein [Sporosarcina pasteurii]SUI99576.1 Lactose-binding protein precursor [Sporosarcina pasteurii]